MKHNIMNGRQYPAECGAKMSGDPTESVEGGGGGGKATPAPSGVSNQAPEEAKLLEVTDASKEASGSAKIRSAVIGSSGEPTPFLTPNGGFMIDRCGKRRLEVVLATNSKPKCGELVGPLQSTAVDGRNAGGMEMNGGKGRSEGAGLERKRKSIGIFARRKILPTKPKNGRAKVHIS